MINIKILQRRDVDKKRRKLPQLHVHVVCQFNPSLPLDLFHLCCFAVDNRRRSGQMRQQWNHRVVHQLRMSGELISETIYLVIRIVQKIEF